jgi:hypothetical protein
MPRPTAPLDPILPQLNPTTLAQQPPPLQHLPTAVLSLRFLMLQQAQQPNLRHAQPELTVPVHLALRLQTKLYHPLATNHLREAPDARQLHLPLTDASARDRLGLEKPLYLSHRAIGIGIGIAVGQAANRP